MATAMAARRITVRRKTKHRKDAEAIRQALSLSQDAFAKALGISRRTVIRWKSEHFTPPPRSAEGRLLAVMEEIVRLAREMWGEEGLSTWMHSSIPALAGARPVDVLVEKGPVPVRDVLKQSLSGGYA